MKSDTKKIKILAIDTSCDETSVAVLENERLLSNVLPSQIRFHSKYGGVVPSIAKLAHIQRIDNVVKNSLKKANLTLESIDAIAVTYGPGLAIALEVGVNKAKELASKYNKPLIAINHMEGHLLSSFVDIRSNKQLSINNLVRFPALGFLISGGHTELIFVKEFGIYEKVGETLDDSCGESFDKCGRMLGLGYPAGPIITKFSRFHRKNIKIEIIRKNQSNVVKVLNILTKRQYELPIPMLNSGDLNFSYSGLKTAFKQLIDKLSSDGLESETIKDLCVLFETSAIAQLKFKLEKAIKQYDPKEVWLGGGVIASSRLRSELRSICKRNNVELRFPHSKKLTGDNAAMIAIAAYKKIKKTKNINHDPENGIFLSDFSLLDREPSLSL